MSFAVFTDTSFSKAGEDWEAEIALWNGSSASNDLRIMSASRRVGELRINPFNPILPAVLRTRIYDESRTIHDKILNNDKTDLRVTIKKNSTIWHQGLLQRVDGGDRVGRSNPVLRLVWNDSLPQLKTKDWSEQGRATLLEFLWYLCTDSTRTDLTSRVAIGWNDTQADTGNGRSRALQHDLERQIEDGTFWDALSQTLRYYNMEVVQEDGKWRLLHRSYREDGQSFDFEERDTGGTEFTGSRNPTVSLSDSDLHGVVKRPQFERSGWSHEFRFEDLPFRNADFTGGTTESISGNTVPEAWYLINGPTFDQNNDQIEIDPTNKGIDKSRTAYAEQVHDRVLIYAVPGPVRDEVDLVMNGEIDILDTNETSDVDVVVGELKAVDPEGASEWYDLTNGWQTSQTYLRQSVAQSDSGTQTRNFSIDTTISAPEGTGGTTDWWIFRLRLYAEENPTSGDPPEVDVVRWDKAGLEEYTSNAEDDQARWRGVRYTLAPEGDRQTDRTIIGNPTHEATDPETSLTHPRTGSGGIRFLDSRTSDWEFLHRNGSEMEHATRTFEQSNVDDVMEVVRLHDRYAMMARDLFRLEGLVKRDKVQMRDTVTYNGRTWIPHYLEERISDNFVRIGLTELRNDSVPSEAVEIRKV